MVRDRRSEDDKGRGGGRNKRRGGGGRRTGSRGRDRDRSRSSGRRPLEGVGDAETNSGKRGPYLVPGKMVYEVLNTDWVQTRDGDDLLVHELRVASVYECRPDPDAADDPKYADPDTPYAPGDECVFTVLLKGDSWQRNLKTWILGFEPDIDDDDCDDFANECYPPEIPDLDDLIDDLFEEKLKLDGIKIEDEGHAEEVAKDHLRALKAWKSPIAGMFVFGETWRRSGKAWVNSQWRPASNDEIDELGFDALDGERGRSRRRERDEEPRGRSRDRDDDDDDDDGDDEPRGRTRGRGRSRDRGRSRRSEGD